MQYPPSSSGAVPYNTNGSTSKWLPEVPHSLLAAFQRQMSQDTQETALFSGHCLGILIHALKKEMATHSGVLAWRIPGAGEPGGLTSIGHTESDTTEQISTGRPPTSKPLPVVLSVVNPVTTTPWYQV